MNPTLWRQVLTGALEDLARAERDVTDARVRRDGAIRELAKAGVSQAELAQEAGMSRSAVGFIVTGTRRSERG